MRGDERKLRHILDIARACVYRGEAYQAFGHLNSVKADIDDLAGTPLWAECGLIYAGALAGKRDPAAEFAFDDALTRISELSEPDPALKMRAHEDFGKYLAERGWPKRAREQYRSAEKIAESLDQLEDLARFQMCVIRMDLEESKDSRLGAFQRLKEAARDGYTHLEQREAWIHYTETFQRYGPQLIATRKGEEASVDYFRGVLSEIRRRRSEIVE